MKKLYFLAVLLPLLFCACSSFIEENSVPIIPAISDLQAGFADETRTYVENGRYLRWHEDDRLTAFYGNTLNRQYKFKGKTGDNSGSFAHVPSGDLETGNAFDRIYALYPYNETSTITDEGEISLTLPALQSYAENSFGRGANTMIAVTENLEDTFLAFKNACGYLKLKLYNADGATIKSIEVKGNNGEKIAGAATATIAFGEAPVLLMADDATDTITIDCGDGVSLGTTAETATEFWTVIPQTTFTKGITIKITDSQGGIFEKSTDNEVAITRNAIQPMAAVEIQYKVEIPTSPIYGANEILYTSSDNKIINPYIGTVFGATITSNTYDEERGCWVIIFNGNITSIGNKAFYKCSTLTSVTIPNSVTSIGDKAFRSCTSLTSITIPDGVTEIGSESFANCSSLSIISIGKGVTSISTSPFYNCPSLSIVNISDLAAWCKIKFTAASYIFDKGAKLYLNGKEVNNLTIGKDITSIAANAFYGCSSLTNVTIEDNVSSIGGRAFTGCSNLKTVTIGKGVTEIGGQAFENCNLISNIYCRPIAPPSGGKYMFDCCSPTLRIFVSETSRESYINASQWSKYAGYLLSYDFDNNEIVKTDREIWYTSNDGNIIKPDNTTGAFGSAILVNNYVDNIGVIVCESNIDKIGNGALDCCYNLTNLTMPNSVISIGENAFSNCTSLTTVTIPDSVISIGEHAFTNCTSLTTATIGNGVTSIGRNAFTNCKLLKNMTIPNSVVSIGMYSFLDCSGLENIIIGSGTSMIGDGAFYRCKNLETIKIDSKLTSIGDNPFLECNNLKEVYYSGNLSDWCKIELSDCDSNPWFVGAKLYIDGNELAEITIPSDITQIKNYTFSGNPLLTSATIHDSVTSIGNSAFYNCTSLTNIAIPNSVTSIGNSVFYNCIGELQIDSPVVNTDYDTSNYPASNGWLIGAKFTKLIFGENVTNIGDYAFSDCTSLTSITIPDSVTSIGDYAFCDCTSLKEVYCKPTTPPSGDSNMFYNNASGRKIYVPRASVDDYKAASDWSDYADDIEPYDFE